MLFTLFIRGVKGTIKAARIIVKNKTTQKILCPFSDITSPPKNYLELLSIISHCDEYVASIP